METRSSNSRLSQGANIDSFAPGLEYQPAGIIVCEGLYAEARDLFRQQSGDRRIEVLKSYDQGYARAAFHNMDDEALQRLWNVLKPEEIYDPGGPAFFE